MSARQMKHIRAHIKTPNLQSQDIFILVSIFLSTASKEHTGISPVLWFLSRFLQTQQASLMTFISFSDAQKNLLTRAR